MKFATAQMKSATAQMKSTIAQIPRYIMAYSPVFTDAFLTTQCTGHTDAATTLLTFRLQTTTELLSTQLYSIYTSKQHTVLAGDIAITSEFTTV